MAILKLLEYMQFSSKAIKTYNTFEGYGDDVDKHLLIQALYIVDFFFLLESHQHHYASFHNYHPISQAFEIMPIPIYTHNFWKRILISF